MNIIQLQLIPVLSFLKVNVEHNSDPHWNLLTQLDLNYEDCASPCLKQGDGSFQCKNIHNNIVLCFDPVNLNQVQAKTDQIKATLLVKINTWSARISTQINNFDGLKQAYPSIKAKNSNLQGKVDLLNKMKIDMLSSIKNAYIERGIYTSLAKQVNKWKASINNSQAEIKEQIETRKRTNCSGMPGYTAPFEGDGVNGWYFSSSTFHGGHRYQKVDKIDFVWVDEPPMHKINKNNFSIRFNGFLKVPKTGDQQFTLETDDGGFLSINGDTVIQDRIEEDGASDWLEKPIQDLQMSIKMGTMDDYLDPDQEPPYKNKSNKILLEQDKFYEQEVRQVHTVHNTLSESGVAYIHLKWESTILPLQVIPRQYLFTRIMEPKVKIEDIDESQYELDVVQENGPAFLETKQWRTVDVPFELNGALRLKSFSFFDRGMITFTTDSPILLQIAFDWNEPNPLEGDWVDSNLEMSILKLEDDSFDELKRFGFTDALEQINMAIQVKRYTAGQHKIPVKVSKGDFLQLQILITPDPNAKNFTCGGELKELSLFTGGKDDILSICESSSSLSNGQECKQGLNGKFEDEKGGIWKSMNEGVGSWMNILFKEQVMPLELVVMQPNNPHEMNRKLEVCQSESNCEKFELLRREGGVQSFDLKAAPTKVIRLEVKSVWSTINNGFALTFKGNTCKDQDEVKEKEDIKFDRISNDSIVYLRCNSTLDNTQNIKRTPDSKTMVYCVDTCRFKDTLKFQGNKIYSGDSPICRSAFQEGVIGTRGGGFQLHFEPGKQEQLKGPQKSVECSPEHKTKAHDTSYSLSELMPVDIEYELKQKEGEDVDFKDPVKCWIRARITSIDEINGSTQIKVTSKSGETKQNFPSKEFTNEINKCGTQADKKGCKEENNVIVSEATKAAKQMLSCNTQRYGDCGVNPRDCAFEPFERREAELMCTGDMKLLDVDQTSHCHSIKCMSKCISKSFKNEDECTLSCPYQCTNKRKTWECNKN